MKAQYGFSYLILTRHKIIVQGAYVKYGIISPKFIWAPCALCIAEPPPPPHLGSYTRALFVSQERRHLSVTPWQGASVYTYCKIIAVEKQRSSKSWLVFISFLVR